MHIRLTPVIALSFFGMIMMPAHADPAAQARKTLQAIYSQENAAAADKNLNGTFGHEAADYTTTDTKGRKLTLEQSRQSTARLFGITSYLHAVSAIQAVTLQGKKATVIVKDVIDFVIVNPQSKKQAQIHITDTSKDVWLKGSTSWFKKSSQTIESHESHPNSGINRRKPSA